MASDQSTPCESCGTSQTRMEYNSVNIGTPAAQLLGLSDPDGEYHIVCDDCYERATEDRSAR